MTLPRTSAPPTSAPTTIAYLRNSLPCRVLFAVLGTEAAVSSSTMIARAVSNDSPSSAPRGCRPATAPHPEQAESTQAS